MQMMTRITPPQYSTDSETTEVAQQAQDLFTLAEMLVARAEQIRDAAEKLAASAHIDAGPSGANGNGHSRPTPPTQLRETRGRTWV
jgi:hypothetical protein